MKCDLKKSAKVVESDTMRCASKVGPRIESRVKFMRRARCERAQGRGRATVDVEANRGAREEGAKAKVVHP
jgi:hypothetical protein